MKKIAFIALAILSAFTFFSCQKEKTPEPTTKSIKFQITVADLNPATKATKTGWYVGDKVNIWLDGNFQKTPDLVMAYNGSEWVAEGDLRPGCTPAASGTMKVIFESYNDFSLFVGSQSSTGTWFPFPTGTIGSITNNVFNHRLVAYSYPDEYTYSGGTLTANIASWKVLTDFQVVVTGLPEGTYAMTPDNPLRVPRGIQVSADRVYLAGNDASYYVLGQPNADGQAFHLAVDPSWTGGTSTLSVTLVDAKGHQFNYVKRAFSFSASGTYQAVKLAFENFKGVNNDHMVNGNEFVDMGAAGKWATMNVGANKPEEDGDYFAWGETEPYYYKATDGTWIWKEGKETGYTWASYFDAENGDSSHFITYNANAGKLVLEAENDAATANWGSGWRMPTKEEWRKLIDQCTWDWVTVNGRDGCQYTAPNGNSIFFPAAGDIAYDQDPLNPVYVGNTGYYWSSSIKSSSLGEIDEKYASRVMLYRQGSQDNYIPRIVGLSVRPVVAE